MRRLVHCFLSLLLLSPQFALASTIFGEVSGVVHDPQPRPIRGATVTLRAAHSSFEQTVHTNGEGGNDLEWHVPAGPDGKVPISAWRRVH